MTVISSGVAFSAISSINVEPVDDKESESLQKGTPMQLQVSMVTTIARPMSAPEFQSAMEFINNSKDSIKDLVKKGKDFYEDNKKTFKRVKLGFKAMQGVGEIVTGILKFIPDGEDPMVKNLMELEANVKALSDKLTDNFSEMKNLMSEQTFFTNIMSPTSVLIRYMRSCLKYPGEDSKENFRKAYQIVKPLRLQYELSAYLKQKTTNPLRQSMDSEKVKTKATFEKWEDIYCRVMAQFLLLEAFAGGLLGTKSETDFDRLVEASSDILNDVDNWRKEYGKDQAYWEDFKTFLKPYMDERTDLNNSQKAEVVGARLNNYLTNDAFYMCIFNEAKWQQDYTYYCAKESEQMVGVWGGKAKCNIFIYRSRETYWRGHGDYEHMRIRIGECSDGKLFAAASLEWLIGQMMVEPGIFRRNEFVALIDPKTKPIVYYYNYLENEQQYKGPGHTQTVSLCVGDNFDRRREMQIIIAFP